MLTEDVAGEAQTREEMVFGDRKFTCYGSKTERNASLGLSTKYRQLLFLQVVNNFLASWDNV